MEMPTPCEKCGEVFELLDGLTSEKWFKGYIICEPCGSAERAEIERDEEISALKEEIEGAEYTLKSARKRLVELGERVAPAKRSAYLSEVFRIVEGATRADFDKMHRYAALLADKLEADGEENSARWLRQILEGKAGARIVALGVKAEREPCGGYYCSEEHGHVDCGK
jgi:hypothetical protein